MEVLDEIILKRRRDLLPIWIKIFLWIFLFMALLMPVAMVFAIMDYASNLSIYGFESNTPFSAIGFIITSLITYKGIIAYGLWTEKDWAVKHAINDAIIGILACTLAMILPLFLYNIMHFTFRLELIVLVPYLFKMREIKNDWNQESPVNEANAKETVNEISDVKIDVPQKEISYKKYSYQCDDGAITIEQEFQNPNIGERVFLNDKPAPFGKYKLGFMSHIFVDSGIIQEISNF